jgi:serine/threonine protein kinase/tetratricopeptide (TPR) repeat protein
MSVASGTRLGTYEILGPLGAGGMGVVYRARDLRLGREVAIKVLPAGTSSSPDRLARFEREARTVAGLNHPNIIVLHSVEEEAGVRFLTMELVEGQNLSALIVPGGLPLARLLELVLPLADALVAAHEHGVIHRDLKPANVMVTREGRVKVLDFGLAKMAGEEIPLGERTLAATVESPISSEGQVLGTAPYMAPEQIRGERADARSDLFALGIILYELATGRRPFGGASPADVSSAILRDPPVPVQMVRSDLPRDLDRIVGRCLEKNPTDRFQNARDVYNDLRHVWRDVERSAGAPAPTPPGALPFAPPVAADPASRGAAGSDVPSIAVLPFVNRSASADDEYFSDGLADELLNVLSRIRGLRVIARTSAFQFKGATEDAATIGRKLDVATLLEGSVRKSGNRVRISVQLVKVSDSSHLWSEMYDRTLDDIFAVQDDIAQSVVKELRTTLLGETPDSSASGAARAEVARAAKGRATDPEGQRLLLLARHLIARYSPDDVTKGIRYLHEALARDSEFAAGWNELAMAFAIQAFHGWVPSAEGLGRAREALGRALELEPDLAEGYALLGAIQVTGDWDFRGARSSYARALELAPGNARVLSRSSTMAMCEGRIEDAIGLMRRAVEQDPLNPGGYHNLGSMQRIAGRFFEAETSVRRALELAPQSAGTRCLLSLILLDQGRSAEALTEAIHENHELLRRLGLAIVYHTLGRTAESDAALHELIEEDAEEGAPQIAEVHAVRGETDAAFEWLQRAFAKRDPGLTEMKCNPQLRSLHGDPRWAPLVRQVGLES